MFDAPMRLKTGKRSSSEAGHVILQRLREEAEHLEGELRATRYLLASGRKTTGEQFGASPSASSATATPERASPEHALHPRPVDDRAK